MYTHISATALLQVECLILSMLPCIPHPSSPGPGPRYCRIGRLEYSLGAGDPAFQNCDRYPSIPAWLFCIAFFDIILEPPCSRFWCQLGPNLAPNLGPKSTKNRSKSHPKSIPTCILFSIAFWIDF